MNKRRLLIVGPLPPPVGGVENFTKAILESEELREFETAHCDLTKGRPKQTQGQFDFGNLRWAFIHFRRLKNAIRTFNPDVVYMPVSATWAGFFRDAAMARIVNRSGKKLIGHAHGGWFNRILEATGWKSKIVKKTLDRFDMLLVLGSPWLKEFKDYGFKGKIAIVPATTRAEIFDEGEKHGHNYKDLGHGFFLGQVGKRKGVFDILQALYELKKEGKRHKIIFVGPGEFQGEWEAVLQTRTEQNLEDCSEFVGPAVGNELIEHFKNASYFIMPSYEEGLPAAILEAGAFGLPMITTPVGAVTDVLTNNQNALLVEPGNIAQLKDAITQLESEETRQRLGEAAKTTVQNFRPEKVVAKIADAVRSVLP